MISYLSIALPLPVQKLFTYRYEHDAQDALIYVGCRVLVPFGSRILTGIVVELGTPTKGMKDIVEILDDMPLFTPAMLALTRRMSDYYSCSWGEALKAGLPQGMTPQSVMHVSLLQKPSSAELAIMQKRAPKRAALLQAIMEHSGPLTEVYLEKILNTGSVSDQLDALERSGIILCERSVEQATKPRKQKVVSLHPQYQQQAELKDLLNTLDATSPKQALMVSHICLYAQQHKKPVPLSIVLKETNLTSSVSQSLIKKNIIIIAEEEITAPAFDAEQTLANRDESLLDLTVEQQHAHTHIHQALQHPVHKTFLLHGITGSGKTLVYIQAIRSALALGKDCLLLVPEISLTPQLIDRFRAVFGDAIAVLHSKMTSNERYDHWRRISLGKARIVIGARSALFAPFPKDTLGLIIVDEEHEPSYKQESPAPRYNARDFAVVRGAIEQIVVVLGSATPSMESMYNAQTGKYHYLEITSRADGAALPELQCIDIREQRRKGAMQGSFSQEMLSAIIKRITQKEGVILFHNRRGFARFQECSDCAHIPMCKNCTVALTLHKASGMLRCHYCGYAEPSMNACSICGGVDIKEVGSGTQKIEEELQELLSTAGYKARIQRMDLDTTSARGAHREMLTAFKNKTIDILIGTQMVAKGLDFHHVTLVGIIDADHQLFMPDFRASERTFQLLTQVAGRAGRSGELHGEVLLQTSHPEHQAIVAALTSSYELFYNDELQVRRDTHYPPFTRLTRIEFSGPDERKVHEHASVVASMLPSAKEVFERLGPTVPFISRIRKNYRRIVLLKGSKIGDPGGDIMRKAVRHALAHYNEKHAHKSVKVTIDIDTHHAF